MGLRDIVLGGLIGLSLPFVLARPFYGVLVWSWIAYMAPHRYCWALYNAPIAAIVGALLIAGFLFSNENKKLPQSPIVTSFILLLLWFCISHAVHPVSDSAWAEFTKIFKIMAVTLMIMMIINTRERVHLMMWVMVCSVGYFGVKGGLFTILKGGQYPTSGPPGSFFEPNNEAALTMLMTMPLLGYLQLQATNKWIRRGLVAAIVLCAFSVIGSYSRGAFLAGFALIAVVALRSRHRFAFILAVLVLLPPALAFMPQKWHDRMATLQDNPEENDGSARGRLNAWGVAIGVANNNLTGGGFDTFNARNFSLYAKIDPDKPRDVHSIYFQILGEHGYIGLILFLALAFNTLRATSRIITRARGDPDLKWAADLARMVQYTAVAFAVGGAFLGLAYFDYYYQIIAAVAVTDHIVRRHVAGQVPEPAPAYGGGRANALPAASRTLSS
ncbi:MAG: putative O-glycosylation ligase, exosortase A system-associated [Gammaproteobacteria bacterium]